MNEARKVGFKDHFSAHAETYAAARPSYPRELFEFLSSVAPNHAAAWDVGCGNGQASRALAEHFEIVYATDASARQIAQAQFCGGVSYRIAPAERSGLPDQSCDLVTVAQAAHWFDLPAFYAEARRVARKEAVIALWCYGLTRVTAEVDAIRDALYHDRLEPDWPPERRHVEAGYETFEFPFEPVSAPPFAMHTQWSAPQFLAYLSSWSATRLHVERTGSDPIAAIARRVDEAWGPTPRTVTWPLSLRLGRM